MLDFQYVPEKTKPPEDNLLVQKNLILRLRYQRKAEISCKQGPRKKEEILVGGPAKAKAIQTTSA
jgi:hypothetical protein